MRLASRFHCKSFGAGYKWQTDEKYTYHWIIHTREKCKTRGWFEQSQCQQSVHPHSKTNHTAQPGNCSRETPSIEPKQNSEGTHNQGTLVHFQLCGYFNSIENTMTNAGMIIMDLPDCKPNRKPLFAKIANRLPKRNYQMHVSFILIFKPKHTPLTCNLAVMLW